MENMWTVRKEEMSPNIILHLLLYILYGSGKRGIGYNEIPFRSITSNATKGMGIEDAGNIILNALLNVCMSFLR